MSEKFYMAEKVDVAVIGAGHAGIEAALASARLGAKTILFTISMDAVANLPCNPSIGGTAKGHLVREIDALGGEMGKAADAVMIQSRMLNKGKGPAVHSLRVQVDRIKYHSYMKNVLENQPGLILKQAEIVDIRKNSEGAVESVVTSLGAVYPCTCAIICTGTFLGGRIYVGEISYEGGPDGLSSSKKLGERLREMNIPLRRFKTGTPARVHRDSIDFSKLEAQSGDEPVVPMSFETLKPLKNLVDCHIAYTNAETHNIIKANIERSPMYSPDRKTTGIGTRYCPSIEDKVVRFSDKQRHQIFVEPMGLDTKETYIQGMSSSLPEEVQLAFYKTIKGFENLQIIRNAYAIEYDCADPLSLTPTLEFKAIPGLFGAGQFNGTSGYEEAASQGIVAGINAAHKVLCKKKLILKRSESYIGTLIDDLVTKGCMDPYRMMTSRSEYRLLLRQDNADKRLTPIGREIALISDSRWNMFHMKQIACAQERKRLENLTLSPSSDLNEMLEQRGTMSINTGIKAAELLKRPQITYDTLRPFDPDSPSLSREIIEEVEIEIKYDGYIKKQMAQVQEMSRLENLAIPADFNYFDIDGIRLEAREKLIKIMPESVGQASRVSGVSPADISVLLIYLKRRKYGNDTDRKK